MVLDALSRAVADPAGVPLHGSKSAPGLFAGTGPARQAAQRCKDEGYLRVVHRTTRGKAVQEVCAITEKGLAYLLSQVSPRQVLEDLVRALEARQGQLQDVSDATHQAQASLDSLKRVVERVLAQLSTAPSLDLNGLHASWQNNQPEPATTDLLAHLGRWQASGAAEDCPLPELYRRTHAAHPTLTIGQFHDALRRLHDQGQVYLHPWTGPLYDIPEPAYALLVGHVIAYYASTRKSTV
jgi:hypothetical protein